MTIGSTAGAQPHIAASRGMQTPFPGPVVDFDHVRAVDLATVLQSEGIGAFALHQQKALMGIGHVAHPLGVAEPTVRGHHWGRELHASVGKRGQALIEHLLGEVEFVLAAPSGAFGIGPSDGKVDGDDELAIAHDDEEQDAIDTGHGSFVLTAPPSANEPELLAIFSEHGIIDYPSPLPAALGRGAFALGMTPNGEENLQTQASQAFEPGAFGERPEQLRRNILVPSAHAGELMPMSAAKQGGERRLSLHTGVVKAPLCNSFYIPLRANLKYISSASGLESGANPIRSKITSKLMFKGVARRNDNFSHYP